MSLPRDDFIVSTASPFPLSSLLVTPFTAYALSLPSLHCAHERDKGRIRGAKARIGGLSAPFRDA